MSAARLRDLVGVSVEGAALNEQQALRIFDPSPANDSLIEWIVGLRDHGVPAHVLQAGAAHACAVFALNDAEAGCHSEVSGALDQLAAAERAAAQPTLADAITIRGLKRALADHLEILAMLDDGKPVDAADLVEARRTVSAIASTTPRERLLGDTLRHELGGRRHDALVAYVAKAVS